ncbi:MAG TPA: hypothetical protein VLA62_10150 [Solirubrobacterales bacterium]|nr:hypothetical protein [Solirubrobacterales bacterium]
MKGTAMICAPVAMLALGLARPAAADDASAPPQPPAIERLVRQEDARAAELARFEAIAKQNDRSRMLDARERAHASVAATPVAVAPPAASEPFAWGAAVLGLGAGIAAMCVLLGCLMLVRSHGRLRSV